MPGKRSHQILLFVLSVIAPIALRLSFPERGMHDTGPRALLDSFFAVWLCLFFFLLAYAIGAKLLTKILPELAAHEQILFAIPAGLGIIAYGVLAIGLPGWLTPTAIALWLAILFLFASKEYFNALNSLPGLWRKIKQSYWPLHTWQKALTLIMAAILLATIIQCLAPLWDYDGLMYHLEGPRIFLEEQRIIFVPQIFQINGPFTIEMLFTMGLAFGSLSVAKLIHLGYTILFFAATFSFASRHFGTKIAWLALIALLGVPFIPVDAGYANIDLAWATYEFLAIYALTIAMTDSSPPGRLALLSALMAGLALGTKYLSLTSMALLGLWWLWSFRQRPIREIIQLALTFGLIALLIAAPWYLKNYFFSGNPVYPFYINSADWDAPRRALLMYYVNSFGMGTGWKDFLLMPLNMFARFKNFGTVYLEMPSLLFLLVFFFPLVARQTRIEFPRNILRASLPYVTLYFIFWAHGSQQTRFLLPIFPFLAILAALVLNKIPATYVGRIALVGLVGGALIATLFGQVKIYAYTQALNPILGFESKNDFLRNTTGNQLALEFLHATLRDGERALMLWDGRNYYCAELCIPDNAQIRAIDLTTFPEAGPNFQIDRVTDRLRALGVTHLLLNENDRGWLIQYHDPAGLQLQASNFLIHEYLPACAEKIYEAEHILIYKVSC